MNPVFWFLVFLGAVLVWFLGSFVFYPLGVYIKGIFDGAVENMNKDEKKDKNKENNE